MKIRKRLIAWLCCELAVIAATLAYTPAHSHSQSTTVVPSAPAAVPVQQGAPAHPASLGGVATGGRKGASGASGRAANTASSRRQQYGAAPTVLVDPAALANGAYNNGGNAAAQGPIPSPFPASAKGKNGKNVITTETVTTDSVR
jgi:hypothetical protein